MKEKALSGGKLLSMALLNRRLFLAGSGAAIASGRAMANERRQLVQSTSDAPPRCFRQPDGSWGGFEVDLSREVCGLAGLDFQPSPMAHNWARSLRMIESGALDLLTTVSWRAERTRFMRFISIYDVEEIVVLLRKEHASAVFTDLNDFTGRGRVFERIAGAVYTVEFDKRVRNDPDFARHFTTPPRSATGSARDARNVMAARVFRGRIFGALTDHGSTYAILNATEEETGGLYDPDALTAVPAPAFGATPTWLTASLKLPEDVLNRLVRASEEAREIGRFSALWRKWYDERAEPPVSPRVR